MFQSQLVSIQAYGNSSTVETMLEIKEVDYSLLYWETGDRFFSSLLTMESRMTVFSDSIL